MFPMCLTRNTLLTDRVQSNRLYGAHKEFAVRVARFHITFLTVAFWVLFRPINVFMSRPLRLFRYVFGNFKSGIALSQRASNSS